MQPSHAQSLFFTAKMQNAPTAPTATCRRKGPWWLYANCKEPLWAAFDDRSRETICKNAVGNGVTCGNDARIVQCETDGLAL